MPDRVSAISGFTLSFRILSFGLVSAIAVAGSGRRIPASKSVYGARNQKGKTDMRMLIRAAIAATGMAAAGAAAGLLLAPTAGATTAGRLASKVPFTSGTTTITTPSDSRHDNNIGLDMFFEGVLPTAIAPSTQTLAGANLLLTNPSGFAPQFRFTFPVRPGALTGLHPLTGTVRHSGGLVFSDRGSLAEITNLVTSLKDKTMTGIFTPQRGFPSRRVVLFRLGLSHARIREGRGDVRITGISLRFTKAGAAALDRILSTKLFTAGLGFGTATTVLHVGGIA